MRHALKVSLFALLMMGTLALQASPQVQNLTATQRTDATKMVDVYFNIIHNRSVTVSIYASQDNGVTWNLPINLVSGDVGPNIVPGNGKHIVWDVLAEHPNIIYDNVRLKVVADDGVVDITTGLIAYYPFSGNAFDASGNGNNGSVVGAVLSADRYGNPSCAYYFDGNDYISIGQLPQLQGAQGITISCWVKKTATNRVEGFVGKWYTSPYTNNVLLLYNGEGTDTDKGGFCVQYANVFDGHTWVRGSSIIPQQVWVHVAGVWDNTNGFTALYFNGILNNYVYTTQSINHSVLYNTSYPAVIGNWGNIYGGSYYMLGYIDDVRIYNRALTPAEMVVSQRLV